jgi:ATP-dependent helicase/nuclease subunit B
MAAIETLRIPAEGRLPMAWSSVVEQTLAWLDKRGLSPRDAVVLLPFAALLSPLRQAFAARAGWQPRVETTLTLAASLAPARPVAAGQCGGGVVQDRLFAAALLREQSWGLAWAERDAAGFDHICAALVQASQAFCAAAAARPPAERAAFWELARSTLQLGSGPAATETSLLRVALEWAAMSCEPQAAVTDVLFSVTPAAWVLVRIGGQDAVAEAVARASPAPALRIALDPEDRPLEDGPTRTAAHAWDLKMAGVVQAAALDRLVCDDFETEAQAAAASVIEALNQGRAPVALVALDRALVRRVLALLDRDAIPVLDETGWLLSTTQAGAAVMCLLRAAQPGATQDAWLEWIKFRHADMPQAVDALEALWRGRRTSVEQRAVAQRLWQQAQAHLQPMTQASAQNSARPLAAWLVLLRGVLGLQDTTPESQAEDGNPADPLPLWQDAAGTQVLAALHLQRGGEGDTPAWRQAAAALPMTLSGFMRWVASTLQELPFLPLPDPDALVVLTPLARAFGRPFGHLVLPGADHKHLGVPDARPGLIGDSLARVLGMPDNNSRRWQQRLALLHLLRAGPLTVLRREQDEGEPLADSPDIAWLAQLASMRTDGGPSPAPECWQPRTWQPAQVAVPSRPVHPPQPSAAADLPQRLSASQLEALRQCPYRFFVRAVLRLDEPEELDAALAKRDYGTWLHAVLHRFHSERDHQQPPAPQLRAAADAATQDLDLDEGELLPYRASFEQFAPDYLHWLAEREMQGWHWSDGESDHLLVLTQDAEPGAAALPWLPLTLHGRIDRLDHGPKEQSQLLDYKTGQGDALARKVRQPLEDTQLAFYAALLGGGTAAAPGLRAAYLALDDPQAPREIEHVDVGRSAQRLLTGLRGEWQRLAAGATMPALGEGAVCETCEARGLCRRDQWAAAAEDGA